jgi:hypothetical protein
MLLIDFGAFSHLLNNFLYFSWCKKHAFWGIFVGKAWTITHCFDGFWVIFGRLKNTW